MSLNSKLRFILVALTAVTLAVILAALLLIVIPDFRKIEADSAADAAGRGIIELNDYTDSLDELNLSRAISTDTFDFARNPAQNAAYIATHLDDDFFITEKLTYAFILDASGAVIFEKTTDGDGPGVTVPGGLTAFLKDPRWSDSKPGGESLQGLLSTPAGMLLVSARPIAAPGNEDASAGTLVMARALDQSIIDDVSKNLGLPVTLSGVNDAKLPSDVQNALRALSASDLATATYAKSVSLHTVAGYSLVNDIYGAPALVLKVTMPRTIYDQAVDSVHLFMFGIFLLVVLNMAGGVVMIKRMVVSRVVETADFARRVRTSGDLSVRMPVQGKDEISDLKTSLNAMIGTLEGTQAQLRVQQQNEAELRRTIESVTDSIATTDLDWNVLDVNDAAVTLFGGTKKSEIIGRNALKFIAPASLPLVSSAMQRTLEQGHSGIVEINMLRRDGGSFVAEVSAAVIKNAGGAPAGFVVSSRDVTERKKAETRLRAQHDVIERILATLPNPVLVVSEAGNTVLANQAFYSTFGVHEAEVKGAPVSRFMPVKELSRLISTALAGDRISLNTEFRIELSGKERLFSATAISMPPQEILLVFMDLTDMRERQERLYLNDRLASIGELAAGVAHELGTPLSSIIMFSELLSRRELPADVLDDVKTVQSEAQRGTEIIRNLLSFARKNNAVRQKTSVSRIVDAVMKLRSHEHKVKNIRVVKKWSDGLPEVSVDFSQMQQVFLNIIVNAEQAMFDAHKGGALTIAATAGDGFVRIAFSDDGPGISEADLPHIFDPFFTTKPMGEGTGLGLSICYGIVAQHGGRLSVSSQPGAGAAFTVELPASA